MKKSRKRRNMSNRDPYHDWCECEMPGMLYSGHRGVLADVKDGVLSPHSGVWACHICNRYATDEEAFAALQSSGSVPEERTCAEPPEEIALQQKQFIATVRPAMWISQQLRRSSELTALHGSLVAVKQAHAMLVAQLDAFFSSNKWPKQMASHFVRSIDYRAKQGATEGLDPAYVASVLATVVSPLVAIWKPAPVVPFQFNEESNGENQVQSSQRDGDQPTGDQSTGKPSEA